MRRGGASSKGLVTSLSLSLAGEQFSRVTPILGCHKDVAISRRQSYYALRTSPSRFLTRTLDQPKVPQLPTESVPGFTVSPVQVRTASEGWLYPEKLKQGLVLQHLPG